MTDELNGDFLIADEKIEDGTDWQDTVTVPVAGDELEFGFQLLNERVRTRVQNTLPMDEFRKYRNNDASDEHQRLMELQRKNNLTDEERDELLDLIEDVNPEQEGRDKLGDDAVDTLMDAGKHAIVPTDGDVTDVMNAEPSTQEQILGEIPDHLDRETARAELKSYMEDRIEGQPFPIKFVLGQNAYLETMSVLGNGFQTT